MTYVVLAPNLHRYKSWLRGNLLRPIDYVYANSVDRIDGITGPVTVYDLGGYHPKRKVVLDRIAMMADVRFVRVETELQKAHL